MRTLLVEDVDWGKDDPNRTVVESEGVVPRPFGVAFGAFSVPSSSEGLLVSVPLLVVPLQSPYASADCLETPVIYHHSFSGITTQQLSLLRCVHWCQLPVQVEGL